MEPIQKSQHREICILTAVHKPYWIPDDPVYLPVQGGREYHDDIGFQGDHTGDNISRKNSSFCELTILYWTWKNLKADYVGLVHYRRYFTRREISNVEERKREILTGSEWRKLLHEHSVIVGKKRRYYIETNESHYCHAHHAEGLNMTKDIIRHDYPEYLPYFQIVMHRTWAHMFNMFVMRRDLFDAYCEWLFSILFKLERRLDISEYDVYEKRVFGFIGELLLDVWLERNHIPYYEQNISVLEKQNWIVKGGSFLKRKFLHKQY